MSLEMAIAVLIRLVLGLVMTFAVIIGSAVVLSWGDRKVFGFTQDRYGPLHYGPWGLLQPVADTLKLLLKEDVVPSGADRVLHLLAPIIFVMPTVGAFVVLPLGADLVVADLNIGLVYIAAISTFAVIGVMAAGWSSNNKYSTLGAIRSVAQMVSYEVPL
nr:NADH-quinone oxidoreductase subunit H [Dehalococcoidales bacterium]